MIKYYSCLAVGDVGLLASTCTNWISKHVVRINVDTMLV